MAGNINFSLDDAQLEHYNSLFPDGPRGARANFALLLDAYTSQTSNPNPDNNEEIQRLNDELSDQQHLNNQLQADYNQLQADYTELQDNNSHVTEDNPQLQDDYSQLQSDYNELQNKYNDVIRDNQRLTLLTENQNKTPLSDDQLIISMPSVVQNMLQVTAERLSIKYNTTVDASDILSKMFLRYTVERLTSWFYPFCLSDRDIESISGISSSQWHEFINKK